VPAPLKTSLKKKYSELIGSRQPNKLIEQKHNLSLDEMKVGYK